MLCSKPNGINCTENYYHEDCEQLENANFNSYGCKLVDDDESDYFACSNRMDKKEVLFESPPISVKKTRNSINYNTELLFDDYYIYCGKYNFTYEDFNQVRQDHGMEDCDLADGRKVPIGDLWYDLLIDFSFNMTEKMNEL